MSFSVSVVIPNWNGKELLKRNLPKILALSMVGEWILVDDGSTDGSASWTRKNFPEVTVLAKRKNEGFVKTVNAGVAASKGKLVAIVNPDLVPKKDTVEKAASHFTNPRVFGVTFRETNEAGWGIASWKHGWIEISAGDQNHRGAHETFWGSGGETIYRKKVWEMLGGYDEIFSPGYWEDVDIGFRARRRGWKLIWEPEAIVESSTRGLSFGKRWSPEELVKIKERNRLIFMWKNILDPALFREHVLALVKRSVVHPGYLVVVKEALKFRSEILKKRVKERKEAVLTNEQIFAPLQEA